MVANFANPFLRLQVSGIHMAEEEWSWSLAFDGGTRPATVPQAVIDAVVALHQGAGLINSRAKLTTIKINEIGADGKYTQADTVAHDFVPGLGGNVQGNPAPPQVALAVSLRTARRRGAGAFGRFYLPLPNIMWNYDTGVMDGTLAQSFADAAGTMIVAIQNALGAQCIVASQGGAAGSIPAAHVPVTGVEVGRVYDTQRRRRESLKESHVPSATFT